MQYTAQSSAYLTINEVLYYTYAVKYSVIGDYFCVISAHYMYFAKNLRFLRRKAEWSQSDLGDKIGTDYNTISRYESGKSTPKLEALTKLAHVFEMSIEELRNVDLTRPAGPAQVEEPNKDYPSPSRLSSTSTPTEAVKHPLVVSIELDGTKATLERAVARLTAINNVIAATN